MSADKTGWRGFQAPFVGVTISTEVDERIRSHGYRWEQYQVRKSGR
jgi:hypothetical protein